MSGLSAPPPPGPGQPGAAGRGRDPARGSLPGAAWGLGTLALAAATVWILVQVRIVLLVIIGSLLLAVLLQPAADRVRRLRVAGRAVGRRTSAACVVVLAVAGLSAVLYLVVPALWDQVLQLARDLPAYFSGARQKLLALLRDPALLPPDAAGSFETELNRMLAEGGRRAAGWAVSQAVNLLQILGYVVIPLGAYYVLADGQRLRRDMLAAMPPAWRPWATGFLDQSAWALAAYLRGQVAVCASAGLLYAVIFLVLGVPHAVALGVLAGIAEAIPYLGSLVVGVTVGVTGLPGGLGAALRGLAGYVVGNQIVNYVLTPRFMSRELDIHPFYVILAALAGASLGGPGGALLALPAAAVAQTLVRRAWGDVPEGSGPAPPPPASPHSL